MTKPLLPVVTRALNVSLKPSFSTVVVAAGVVITGSTPVAAQITGDSTLRSGTSPQILSDGTQTLIQGGARQGGNLFHSFLEFNVLEGQQVYFVNPDGIKNILSRVTGTLPSEVNGTLGVDGPANLFLLNPNGILFGPNARLDLQGSFLASTAEDIAFEDGTVFSAMPSPHQLLTISTPLGVQYGTRPNGDIVNQGQLAVRPGQHLTLFGGTIQQEGQLLSPGGQVEVLGDQIDLASQSLINVSQAGQGGVILVGGDLQGQPTRPTATVITVAPQAQLRADALGQGDGGQVILWADDVTQFEGNITATGGAEATDIGGFVEVSCGIELAFDGQVETAAANGRAGTLLLDPTDITIANGSGTNTANVLYETVLEGLAGNNNLVITATNNIVLEDLTDNALDLQPGTGEVRITADSDGDGAGAFVMADQSADTIRTFGRNITISGASLQLGNISTSTTPDQDVGPLLGSARAVGQASGVALATISGQLSTPTDVDLYEIYISGGTPFSATTVANPGNPALPDTQLFLFDAAGRGVLGNDNDAACVCRQSTLTAAALTPGTYYLGVASYATEPTSAGGAIFPDSFATLNFTDLETPLQTAPLNGWVSQPGIQTGDYDITLTGVTGVANAVTEMPLSDSGAITLTATNGDIQAGQLTTAATGTGGEVTVTAAGGGLDLTGTLNTLGGQGNAGQVSLQSSGDIRFRPGVSVLSRGQLGGALTLQAAGDIVVQGGLLSQQSTTIGVPQGLGGGFNVQGRSLLLQDGAQLLSETLGTATLPSSQVNISGEVFVGGFGSVNLFNPFGVLATQVGTGATGEGGALVMNVGTLIVNDAAVVATRSFGRGNAGDLTILGDEVVVAGAVEINNPLLQQIGETVFESELSSESEREEEEILFLGGISNPAPFDLGEANAGDLRLEVRRLRVENGGEVSAGTHSRGDGGNFILIADEVIVTGQTVGERSELGTETVPEFLGARPPSGNAGNLFIQTDRLSVTNGGQIAAATLALGGTAGRIDINAREVEVAGGFVYNGEVKNSSIVSEVLNAAEEQLQGNTNQDFGGQGGTVAINAQRLSVREGGRISASTAGNGEAGDVAITVPSIELTGAFTPTVDLATGATPADTTSIRSGIFASSSVDGQAAGNIGIQVANQLRISDRATIEATTRGDQGNITLTGGTVLMRNGSQITTNAAGTSTGGNITLDLNLLIAAPLLGNSDITANAEQGSGGQINIATRFPVFGFQVAEADTFRNANLTPADVSTNDITAFSQFNPAIDTGTVTIEPPELDPTPEPLELVEVADPSDRIATGCVAQQGNRFTVSGQGGLPADPRRGLNSAALAHDFRLRPASVDGSEAVLSSTALQSPSTVTLSPSTPLIEAQTWTRSSDGTIQLTAQTSEEQMSMHANTTCQR